VNRTEVAIVGGGIIGLSAALELSSAGIQVTVFERGHAMNEASSAAAGMLAAGDPDNATGLRELAELSRRLYPQFLADVERLSGERVSIRTTRAIQGGQEVPEGCSELSAGGLEAAVTGLAQGVVAGGLHFFSLDEKSLDPRDLARALPKAARAAGVVLIEDAEVTAVVERGSSIEVEARTERWTTERLIHASGAWAARLTGLPVHPRKGQMVVVEECRSPRLKVVLRTPEIYLVPRGDGRIVIGATVEDAGFNKQVDDAVVHGLLNQAAALWPPVREARVVDFWAGLRPATADELPVIDACGERCWVATGHFRNGILLATGTARVLREMILGKQPSVDVTGFRCGRFAMPAVHC
jgi:glycine oxidase